MLLGLLAPRQPGKRASFLGGHLPASLFLLFAVLTSAYVLTSDDGFGAHGDQAHAQALDPAIAAVVASLTPAEAALVDNSRHEHDDLGVALQESDLVLLYAQVAAAREATAKYEDIEVALDDGYTQVTQDLPLIGAHFLNVDYARDGLFDPTRPELLIYAYQDGGWRFYGPSYITRLVVDYEEEVPEGFAGPFDAWHWHANWCFTIAGARVTSPEECSQRSGFFIERMDHQMHLWVRENPSGMFNHGHPELLGSDARIVNVPRLLQVLQLALE